MSDGEMGLLEIAIGKDGKERSPTVSAFHHTREFNHEEHEGHEGEEPGWLLPAQVSSSARPAQALLNRSHARASTRFMPILRFTLPNQPEALSYLLDGTHISIGRGADNTIQIPDRSVSARHAELILVRGHYRLHDLESTNLTCVDGRPVSDFHLHEPCRLRFGNAEADFSPETPEDLEGLEIGHAPTQSEIDFLRRDNLDLQNKVAALQRQLDILGQAPLLSLDTGQASVAIETHRRVLEECAALRRENSALQLDAGNFKCDIDAILRDRDALRQAWVTVRAELAGAAN